jgi:hypothetical protein
VCWVLSVWLSLLGVLPGVTGCSASQPAEGCPPHGTGPAVAGGLECGLPVSFLEVEGGPLRLGVRARIAVSIDLAGVVRTEAEATVHVLLATDAGVFSDGSLEARICDIQFPAIDIPGQANPTRLALVPAAYRSLEPVEVSVTVSERRTCGTFVTGWGSFLIGARLSAPDAALPVDLTSPWCEGPKTMDCLLDQEPDGWPGATLLAEHMPLLDVEALDVDLRTDVQLSGLLLSPHRIGGQIGFSMEVHLLGCRLRPAEGGQVRPCTPTEAGLMSELDPWIEQLPAPESFFSAVPVPTELGCEDLLAQSDAWFGR